MGYYSESGLLEKAGTCIGLFRLYLHPCLRWAVFDMEPELPLSRIIMIKYGKKDPR